jgi:site-specific recombinase XerD
MKFEDIQRIHVVKYKSYLDQKKSRNKNGYAPNTINRKISSVSSFFMFLLRRDVIEKNPAEFCVRPKRINVRDTQAFDEMEMRQLFALVIRKANPMHRAVILLLFTTGMRNAEVRNVKLNDFESRDGMKVLRYIGKGQKLSRVAIHPATGFYLGKYLEWMQEQGRPIGPEDYLFQQSKLVSGKTNRVLSHTALGYVVKKWARKVNNSKRITPHSGRATFISALLQGGEDIYSVAQAVNHSDVRTTARYDKRKQSFTNSPVFNLKFFQS